AQSRVVIDDIEVAEFLDRAVDRAADIFFVCNVSELENRVAAMLLTLAHHRLAALAIEIGDHDRGTFAREPNCGGTADSACCSSDYCNLLFEFTHDLSPRLV